MSSFATDRTHLLDDGRVLDWAEYGDPGGYPVLWLHGVLSSKREVLPVADAVAATGLRVVAVNRPGVGSSTLGPTGYSVSDCVADVMSLLDTLGVGEFAIVAYSGASVYAYTAMTTHPDRVSRLSVVSGVAAPTMPRRNSSTAREVVLLNTIARRWPALARRLVTRTLGTVASDPAEATEQLIRSYRSRFDREILLSPQRDQLFAALTEAGRQGAAGIVADVAIIAGAQFPAADRVGGEVRLWHGSDDRSIHVGHARWMVGQLPNAELTEWPAAGHLHLADRWAEVCRSARP